MRDDRAVRPIAGGIVMLSLLLLVAPSAAAQEASVQVKDLVCVVPPDKRPEAGGTNLRFELVEFRNTLSTPVDMSDWTMRNSLRPDRPVPDVFTFPDGFVLPAGAVVTVHTGVGDDNATDLFWDRVTEAFANDLLDGVVLRDENGDFVHSNDCGSFAFGCPDVEATALGDGSVRLDFGFADDLEPEFWRVYRADSPGPLAFEEVATPPGSVGSFTDDDAPEGRTVRYIVVAEFEDSRGENCPETTVTTIPYFPTGPVVAVALAGAVGVYVVARRRA